MAWLDEILSFIAHARKPDGSLGECQLDPAGSLKVTLGTDPALASTPDDCAAFVAARVVRAGPCRLFHLAGLSNSSGYLHVFDAAAVPAPGTPPLLAPFQLWPGLAFVLPLPAGGRAFKTGVVWAVSTTLPAFSPDPTGQVWTNAERT